MIEKFLTNLINKVHTKLGLWRPLYIIIGFIIMFSLMLVDPNKPYWYIWVLIISSIASFFITIGKFAQDSNNIDDKHGKNNN